MILIENPVSDELVLSDLDQSNLRSGYTMASANIALVCGLNFRVGCHDRLRVNSDAYGALNLHVAEVREVLVCSHFIFFLYSADVTS